MNKAVSSSGERGVTLIEYVLLISLLSIFCIAAIGILGQNSSQTFALLSRSIESGNSPVTDSPGIPANGSGTGSTGRNPGVGGGCSRQH